MKKNGFTLSELVVALTVIGIASAIILPTATKLMPDTNKAIVINVHSKISSTVVDLLNDDAYYYTPSGSSCEGLECTDQAQREFSTNNQAKNNTKFKTLMASKLALTEEKNGLYTDADGIQWGFGSTSSSTEKTYYTIIIDVNKDNKPNGIYTPNNLRPDQFRFYVNNYGGVTPGDAMTAAYLKNSLKVNAKEEDQVEARSLYLKDKDKTNPRYQ